MRRDKASARRRYNGVAPASKPRLILFCHADIFIAGFCGRCGRSGLARRVDVFHIVLYEPEIPQNTGNIMRLCANQGSTLHLVEPLGFVLSSAKARRAGLDYGEFARVALHPDWERLQEALPDSRFFALTSKGETRFDEPRFEPGDAFVFGPESRGLPDDILARFDPSRRLRIPMMPRVRCMNLSNSAAVMAYAAWSQFGYEGGS